MNRCGWYDSIAPEVEAADNDDREAVAEDNDGVARNHPTIINKTKLTKAQIVSLLDFPKY